MSRISAELAEIGNFKENYIYCVLAMIYSVGISVFLIGWQEFPFHYLLGWFCTNLVLKG